MPDLAYIKSRLGQALAAPTSHDFQTLKAVVRYLRGTTHHVIQYAKTTRSYTNQHLQVYLDAEFANDPGTSR